MSMNGTFCMCSTSSCGKCFTWYLTPCTISLYVVTFEKGSQLLPSSLPIHPTVVQLLAFDIIRTVTVIWHTWKLITFQPPEKLIACHNAQTSNNITSLHTTFQSACMKWGTKIVAANTGPCGVRRMWYIVLDTVCNSYTTVTRDLSLKNVQSWGCSPRERYVFQQ